MVVINMQATYRDKISIDGPQYLLAAQNLIEGNKALTPRVLFDPADNPFNQYINKGFIVVL
jgi:hypothetical protein